MITTCPNPLLLRELAQQEAEFHATRVRRLIVACLVTILWAVLSVSALSIGSAVFVVLGTALTRTSSKRSVRRKVSEAAEDSRARIPAANPTAPAGTPALPAPSGSRTPLQGTAPWCTSPLQVHDASRIGQGQYQALPTMGTAMAAGPNGAATSKQQLTRLSSPLTPPTQLVTTPQELQHFLDTEEERAAHDRTLSGQILNPFASLGSHGRYRVYRDDSEAAAAETLKASQTAGPIGAAAVPKLKHWIAMSVLRQFLEDIDRCSHWFIGQHMTVLDPSQPLSATMPNDPSGTSKRDYLRRHADMTAQERKRTGTSLQRGGDLEKLQMIDLRLRLEKTLQVEDMFPLGRPLSVPDNLRRRQYIIERIRALSGDAVLSAYNPEGGDMYSWKEALCPTDAQLVVHTLAKSRPSLEPHFRLPHRPMCDSRRDLALYIGSDGGPCYYIRHRPYPGAHEELLRPTGGRDGLFHAIVAMLQIVQEKYGGTLGGVVSVLDLSVEGLTNIVS